MMSRFPRRKRGLKLKCDKSAHVIRCRFPPREAWIEIPVNKKEYQSPQAATNKREDLSRADTLYTISVADALIGGKDRKGRYYVKDVDSFADSMDWND